MNTWKLIVLLTVLLSLLVPYPGGAMNETKGSSGLADIPASAWKNLAQKKICFGHQSVGANILDGIKGLMNENPQIKLTIIESPDGVPKGQGAFYHFRVGNNMEPNTKITSFATSMGQNSCKDADIAFFKFCYVDITPSTDPEKLFENYRKNMAHLTAAYPGTTFVHVTLPLTKHQTGLKALIKKMIGKPVSGREDNIVRNRYNMLLLKEYTGKSPVFDLARIEATNPDGTQELFDYNGSKYFALVPRYTSDGGHLNETGRRVVAAELLRFLAYIGVKSSF